ncbi:hypothetical protein [Gilliamella sp. ESL0254]|uniref:hypothetical protein n=1 Tax=Gilliamella sp. ESL0254 TaxID=2705035 RepID=UPI0015804A47|nr:hypothetical protein [Gilliamella sp. ESL0254]NUF28325.1 hypothetical protein [Gilliamella sp. ESL0254]
MGHAQIKEDRLYIPPRDKHVEIKAKPALSNDCSHNKQVLNAFAFGFTRYKKAMRELSKV